MAGIVFAYTIDCETILKEGRQSYCACSRGGVFPRIPWTKIIQDGLAD